MLEARSEATEGRREGFRVVIVTSTLEDWLHRGTQPVLVSMSLHVCAMWVYRVEKTSGLKSDCSSGHQLDFQFASHYVLLATHTQRLATEFRVPLFEGFTMPTAHKDNETTSLYKQLLLRPFAIACTNEPEDVRLLSAFVPLSTSASDNQHCPEIAAQTAFTRAWLEYAKDAERKGRVAFARFLARHEWHSL